MGLQMPLRQFRELAYHAAQGDAADAAACTWRPVGHIRIVPGILDHSPDCLSRADAPGRGGKARRLPQARGELNCNTLDQRLPQKGQDGRLARGRCPGARGIARPLSFFSRGGTMEAASESLARDATSPAIAALTPNTGCCLE